MIRSPLPGCPFAPREIRAGLAAFLDPEALRGSRKTVVPAHAIEGPHYFVVLAPAAGWVAAAPLSSSAASGQRLEIPFEEKQGAPRFRRRPTYLVDPRQVWWTPVEVLVDASRDERSSLHGARNHVTAAGLKRIRDWMRARGEGALLDLLDDPAAGDR